jgi:O-antigen/teichoic acid export membrane protein
VDFGFGPAIGRFVSYAMGGAESLQSNGVERAGSSVTPNYDLLWQLLFLAQTIYRILILVLLIVLGVWGTYLVEMRIHEIHSVLLARLAWMVTLIAALFDIYSNWWVIYLRSMNEVLTATRIAMLSIAVRLIIAAVLLLSGGGLLSLPIGSFFGSLLQRRLARVRCLKMFQGHPMPDKMNTKENLRVLWPSVWRLGLAFISGYLTVNANMAICVHILGLAASAQYGLSAQLLNVISGMASVWMIVKYPVIGQHYARHEFAAVQKILRVRMWLQMLSYLAAAAVLLVWGPFLLAHFGGGKKLLPFPWLALMTLGFFLDQQLFIWTTVIFTGNRLTYLWPMVASNILSLSLSLTLIHFTKLGLGALILGPLLAGSLFNYWFWPFYACRRLETSLFHVLFAGPKPETNS